MLPAPKEMAARSVLRTFLLKNGKPGFYRGPEGSECQTQGIKNHGSRNQGGTLIAARSYFSTCGLAFYVDWPDRIGEVSLFVRLVNKSDLPNRQLHSRLPFKVATPMFLMSRYWLTRGPCNY